MSINKVAKFIRVFPQRIWIIFNLWIKKAYSADIAKGITKLGSDEKSSKKVHNYVTLSVDMKEYLGKKDVKTDEITGISTLKYNAAIQGYKKFSYQRILF